MGEYCVWELESRRVGELAEMVKVVKMVGKVDEGG